VVKIIPYSVLVLLALAGCKPSTPMAKQSVDIQGHRGARGLAPENTIISFKRALSAGVSTLELDVVINGDGDVIVSHEPFFNHEISTGPDSMEITEENEREHNVYQLSQAEIESYDVGLKAHPRFPRQKKIAATKPLLADMVRQSEAYAKLEGRAAPLYNIEIKRTPEGDGVYHPDYKTFTDKVIHTIDSLGIANRTTVQCFDVETLQYAHSQYPNSKLVYLIANKNSLEQNLELLGFDPAVYSPYYELVTEELVRDCHARDIKVIPWTVNKPEDVEQLISYGVDGIISDYPDMAIEILASMHK